MDRVVLPNNAVYVSAVAAGSSFSLVPTVDKRPSSRIHLSTLSIFKDFACVSNIYASRVSEGSYSWELFRVLVVQLEVVGAMSKVVFGTCYQDVLMMRFAHFYSVGNVPYNMGEVRHIITATCWK